MYVCVRPRLRLSRPGDGAFDGGGASRARGACADPGTPRGGGRARARARRSLALPHASPPGCGVWRLVAVAAAVAAGAAARARVARSGLRFSNAK